MKKRLSWIKKSDQVQAKWIEGFIKKVMGQYQALYFPMRNVHYQEGYVSKFMECAKSWDEIAENREFCRNLKAAWNMHTKRKSRTKMVEGSYVISTQAKKTLASLAKDNNRSLSKTIEILLINVDGIIKKAKESNTELSEPTQLNDFMKINEVNDKLESREQELKEVRQKLEDTEKELNISNQKLKSFEESLKISEQKLKSVQHKLEATEKERDFSREKLEPVEESLKINEKNEESNTNKDSKRVETFMKRFPLKITNRSEK